MSKPNDCPMCGTVLEDDQMSKRKCGRCLHEFDIIHVTPLDDEKPHTESHQCHCEPRIMIEGENMICVHNAFDGREGVEWANEILN